MAGLPLRTGGTARPVWPVKLCRVCGRQYQVRPREKPERDWCHDWRCEEVREDEKRLAARAVRRARGRS